MDIDVLEIPHRRVALISFTMGLVFFIMSHYTIVMSWVGVYLMAIPVFYIVCYIIFYVVCECGDMVALQQKLKNELEDGKNT